VSPWVGPLPPTNELVAAAWLAQRVEGLTAGMVATSLPADTSTWADLGFVQVQALPGGVPDLDVPIRRPVFQVDAWAVNPSSAKPPWGKANHLAELIRIAVEGQAYSQPVTLPDAYTDARVLSAYMVSEPLRMPGDPSGYARFTFDLALDWVRA
jgi:hypothetical protein